MVATLTLSFVLFAGSPQGSGAQAEPPRFGKTNAEILRMGRSAWTKFAAEDRMDGSTAGYVSSEGTFGEALAERNDRLMKAKPAYKRSLVGLRTVLHDYANEFISIGSGVTGGGTMWNLTASAISPDVEEILYSALAPSKSKIKDATSAQIEGALSVATQVVQRKRKQIDENKEFSHMSYADCLKALAQARKLKTQALGFSKSLPARTQTAVRRYLVDAANLDMAE